MRHIAVWMICLSALLFSSTAAFGQDRIRKSIDDLTADELEAYIHAIAKIREKSLDDPTVPFSYAHLAGLHNIPLLFDGACMHWKPAFLAWHRAHLFNYEEALRASDPPVTANVTVPYWDWSKPPTGKRYPVAFENDPVAVAQHYGRPIKPELLEILANPERNSDASPPLYPWSTIAEVAKVPTDLFYSATGDNGGIEHPYHDQMHGFIGDELLATNTAANDPIFWSFHNFIDLVWWWRQKTVNETIPCAQECALNGMPATTATGMPGPTTVDGTIRTKEQLGYDFQFTPPAPPAVLAFAAARSFSQRLPVVADLSLAAPSLVRTVQPGPLSTDAHRFTIVLKDMLQPEDLAYTGFVYVYPAGRRFEPSDVGFRDQFLVGHIAQFAKPKEPHDHRHESRQVRIEVDADAYPQLAAQSDGLFLVSIAFHVTPTSKRISAGTFMVTQLNQNTAIGSVSFEP